MFSEGCIFVNVITQIFNIFIFIYLHIYLPQNGTEMHQCFQIYIETSVYTYVIILYYKGEKEKFLLLRKM